MSNIYLLVGVPGSGKSWVANQIKEKFLYLEHDAYIDSPKDSYVKDILELTPASTKPVLIETPFSITNIREPLTKAGFKVTALYICEDRHTLTDRYLLREGKDIPKGHLTRNRTYLERALEEGSFVGTSEAVLKELKKVV